MRPTATAIACPTVPVGRIAVISTYTLAEGADVDVGYFGSADVQNGFTQPLAQSAWSGAGCDFVLGTAAGPFTTTSYVGLTRAMGGSPGEVTLRSEGFTAVWSNPVGATRTGTIEQDDFLDCNRLVLPPGQFRLTLQSDDASLGFSLHDLSSGYTAKTEPWQGGIAWQPPGTEGEDVDFVVSIEDPAPSVLGLAVWRPDATALEFDVAWSVSISADVTGVADDDHSAPSALGSRLLSAAPNPFNP